MNTSRYREVEQRLWASLDLSPTERQVVLPRIGTRLRLQEVGDGPTVVFLHGGSASGANWAPMIPYMSGVRCVLVDRPGCGLSEQPDRDLGDLDSFREFAETFFVDLADSLDLDTANIVATSLGGCYALLGAAAHPERIERMVEFGFVPGAPMTHLPRMMRAGTLPGLRHVMQAIPPTRGAVKLILRQLGLGAALDDGRLTPELIDWFHSLLRDTNSLKNESTLPRELLPRKKSREVLPSSLLDKVTCPVRFIWGGNDPLGGADVATGFVTKFSNAELELWPEGSHAPWIDDPALAALRVRDHFGL